MLKKTGKRNLLNRSLLNSKHSFSYVNVFFSHLLVKIIKNSVVYLKKVKSLQKSHQENKLRHSKNALLIFQFVRIKKVHSMSNSYGGTLTFICPLFILCATVIQLRNESELRRFGDKIHIIIDAKLSVCYESYEIPNKTE